jgi:ABC-type iron transport system FetAB ATPase subunit
MARRFVKYNPAFLESGQLVDNFVVRQVDLSMLLRTVRENTAASNQHFLVIGPRGSGKTTLVRRVVAEVELEEALRQAWYPLVFAEESYNALSVADFWLESLFHLAEQTGDQRRMDSYHELRRDPDEQRLSERALAQLLDFADSIGKRLLLVVENLDMLLSEFSGEDQAWGLRHTLMNEPRLMLLATATGRFEQIEHPARPMFEMFRILDLKPLDDDECNSIWELVAGEPLPGEQIRPIRILTGGNARLITLIAKFGAKRSFRDLLEDLVDLIDEQTDYFKSHLDNMAPTERKVYLALAELWSLSTAKEVAEAARLDVNTTSALLKRLASRGKVLVEERGKRKRWYRISEGIYNIYYLMRRRGGPSARVKAAVRFMVGLYGPLPAAELFDDEKPLHPEDAVAAYDDVIRRYGAGSDEALVMVVKRTLMERARLFLMLERRDESLADVASFVDRFESPDESLDQVITLFVDLAAHGLAEETLRILSGSPAAIHLEPLMVGLRLYLGQEVQSAAEILDVARDVVGKIEGRKREIEAGRRAASLQAPREDSPE